MVSRLFAWFTTINSVNQYAPTAAAAAALIVIYVDCKYCDPLQSACSKLKISSVRLRITPPY